MNLEKKKNLAARTFGVGIERIVFNKERLSDIKEAITKQDIRDLAKDGAIKILEISGTKTNIKRKTRRRYGSIKKKIKNKKKEYIRSIRILRRYISELKKQKKISKEEYYLLRKDIRTKKVRTKSQINEKITSM